MFVICVSLFPISWWYSYVTSHPTYLIWLVSIKHIFSMHILDLITITLPEDVMTLVLFFDISQLHSLDTRCRPCAAVWKSSSEVAKIARGQLQRVVVKQRWCRTPSLDEFRWVLVLLSRFWPGHLYTDIRHGWLISKNVSR